MKNKISITLSQDLIEQVDRLSKPDRNRSAFIEDTLRKAIATIESEERNARDIKIINKNAKRLNREAEDVLSYQVDT